VFCNNQEHKNFVQWLHLSNCNKGTIQKEEITSYTGTKCQNHDGRPQWCPIWQTMQQALITLQTILPSDRWPTTWCLKFMVLFLRSFPIRHTLTVQLILKGYGLTITDVKNTNKQACTCHTSLTRLLWVPAGTRPQHSPNHYNIKPPHTVKKVIN